MLKLQFKDRRRESVWLVDKVFSIGKNARNSLMIDHAGISEFHAELINNNDQLELINKAEGMGVWVNGIPISDQTMVNAGDAITLGELELELVDPKSQTAKPSANAAEKSDWSISSKASWLEQNRYAIKDKVIIGRDATCDIVLPLEHLSRQHVALEIRNGQLFVKDLESANGTYLNGEKVKDSPLKAGDKLKLDVVTFEVGGPTHDPHKTIIRTVSSPDKTKVREPKQANKPTPTKPAPARPTSPATRAAANRKKLSADGKQDWISKKTSTPQPSGKSGATIVVIGLLLLVAAAVVLMQLS
jgi:pSer/pThr/pTyr-binding forkhead associated (FHA) protein